MRAELCLSKKSLLDILQCGPLQPLLAPTLAELELSPLTYLLSIECTGSEKLGLKTLSKEKTRGNGDSGEEEEEEEDNDDIMVTMMTVIMTMMMTLMMTMMMTLMMTMMMTIMTDDHGS